MNHLRNKDGSLSVYGLCCGYIETYGTPELSVKLFQEGACYHVRLIDRNKDISKPFNDLSGGRHWLSFEKLKGARRLYKKLSADIRQGKDYIKTLGGLND